MAALATPPISPRVKTVKPGQGFLPFSSFFFLASFKLAKGYPAQLGSALNLCGCFPSVFQSFWNMISRGESMFSA
jgi:hypothetical protein